MKNLLKMSILLLIVCAISGGSLGIVYKQTKPKIDKQTNQKKLDALQEVMPDATKFDEVVIDKKWIAYKNTEIVGWALKTVAFGYGGPIQIIFGVDKNKKITRIKIIEQNETPGLGAKITEKKFTNQFEGKTKKDAVLKKDDNINGKIDAITAATISSRAVTNAINQTMELIDTEQK